VKSRKLSAALAALPAGPLVVDRRLHRPRSQGTQPQIRLNFYAAQGHAYAAPPGEEPQPSSEGVPPFTARQTTDSWTPGFPR
jgi:hypothetical protein